MTHNNYVHTLIVKYNSYQRIYQKMQHSLLLHYLTFSSILTGSQPGGLQCKWRWLYIINFALPSTTVLATLAVSQYLLNYSSTSCFANTSKGCHPRCNLLLRPDPTHLMAWICHVHTPSTAPQHQVSWWQQTDGGGSRDGALQWATTATDNCHCGPSISQPYNQKDKTQNIQ